MRNYNELCEAVTMKKTIVTRYPKQIRLSEEFQAALKSEVTRFTQLTEGDEDTQPIRNFNEKFIKALKFELDELGQ